MYAVVEIGGRQFRVNAKDTISIPSISEQAGTKVKFDRVLLLGDGSNVTIGKPLVAGARVEATVLDHRKAGKVIVFKKKRRKGYRVKRGHRQPFTMVEITKIVQ